MTGKILPRDVYSIEMHAPTYVANNISITPDGSFLFASATHVMSVSAASRTVTTVASCGDAVVHMAAAPTVDGRMVIVASRGGSVEVLMDGDLKGTVIPHAAGDTGSVTCAAVEVRNSDAYIWFGTSRGTIYRSTCALTGPPTRLTATDALCVHEMHAITAIDLCSASLQVGAVSADEEGSVLLWKTGGQPALMIPSPSVDCVVAVKLICDGAVVVVARGSGKICFLLVSTGALLCEVCAHSRWVTSLSYCKAKELLATTAEDGVIAVWRVQWDGVQMLVKLWADTYLENTTPIGVCLSDDGAYVAVTLYDAYEFRTFTVPPV